MDKEIRFLQGDIEIREVEGKDGEPGKKVLSGHAAVFNQNSVPLWGFDEEIDSGAFDEILGKTDARALIDHDSRLILGRESAKTLRVSKDKTGLRYEVDLPNTSYAADLAESVKRGDIKGSSFGFIVGKDEWTEPEEGSGDLAHRKVMEIRDLLDVSPVTYPAYPGTEESGSEVALRSLAEYRKANQPPEPETDPAEEAEARARDLDLREREATPVGAGLDSDK